MNIERVLVSVVVLGMSACLGNTACAQNTKTISVTDSVAKNEKLVKNLFESSISQALIIERFSAGLPILLKGKFSFTHPTIMMLLCLKTITATLLP